MAWTNFWTIFFTILSGGGGEVLREGWDAVYQYWGRGGRWCYYLGRGEKGTITTRGGAGGGCNGKHFWLMELLLDRTNYFNRFFDRLCICQKFCAEPRRFFIFLSCECETVILTLDSNFYWKYRVYHPPLLSYAYAFWVNLCTISCSTLLFEYTVCNHQIYLSSFCHWCLQFPVLNP